MSLFNEKNSSFLFFFLAFLFFSHTKYQNLTKRNWNRMQSVSSAFLSYKSVSVLNMLKPKFSIWCKNYLQHRPTRTDYTPTQGMGKMEKNHSTFLAKRKGNEENKGKGKENSFRYLICKGKKRRERRIPCVILSFFLIYFQFERKEKW